MNQQNNSPEKAATPVAEKRPYRLSLHGDDRADDYFWMRDSRGGAEASISDAKLAAYLEAENAYTDAIMQPTAALQDTLYSEILARLEESDLSLPYRQGDFYYYFRAEAGKAYEIFCRKRGSLDAPEEVLLDQNELAKGYEYFYLGVCEVSPDGQILAYSADTSGSEQYTLFFLNLTTLAHYPENIAFVSSFAWANDSKTCFYTQVNAANRPDKLFRHAVGNEPALDVTIYREVDEAFELEVSKTRSQAYILMRSASITSSEVHYVESDRPTNAFKLIHPRTAGMLYQAEHHQDNFYILTNEDALNFKLVKTPVACPSKAHWQTVIPHRETVTLESFSAFADYLVIREREKGLPRLRILQVCTGEEHYIDFPDPIYELLEEKNREFNTATLRFGYRSLVTPDSIFDYNMETRERTLKKQLTVKGYDSTQYASDRIWATAPDGTQVPIALVYKKGIEKNGSNPLLLFGYGAYGLVEYLYFSPLRLSLLDRGAVIAIAQVRGGGELGRSWYEGGKLLNKKNTFTDFIACAEHLIATQWTSSDRLAISGRSAGGLLIGAVINMRPDLFKSAIAGAPFVDVLTTLLDTSLPLTVIEWDEWGNPKDKTYYDYIKSYSPYDNVERQNYPNLLITTGLNDSKVGFWEPVKWTAKLRELKTDDNLLLLKINMDAGHSGASGRYDRLKEVAMEYAFLLQQWGLGEKSAEKKVLSAE